MESERDKLKIAVLQRVCPNYRVPLFTQLTSSAGIEMTLVIGEDIPDSKVKNSRNLHGINYRKLKTRFLRLGRRVLPWHVGLIRELAELDPDVILCEGESHFLGYLQAIWYRCFHNPKVALMHWCFISLPGWPAVGGWGHRAWIKRFFRRFFDAFVLYSSFSKDCLIQLGQPSEKLFVATNVCDTRRFIELSTSIRESACEARAKLGLPDCFTVLYLGELDANKRPHIMLDLAKQCDAEKFTFVLLGSGPMLAELCQRATREKLSNVFLPGRVVDELPLYYRASSVLLIPARGGIVISEAMAFGVPVIVHQADGTEYDLVQNEVTGLRLSGGSVNDFRTAIELLQGNPSLCASMGEKSKELLETRYTTDNMAKQILTAARFARKSRNGTITNARPKWTHT
jgi:glycosyltransferase involved in cell wall biosynthesis